MYYIVASEASGNTDPSELVIQDHCEGPKQCFSSLHSILQLLSLKITQMVAVPAAWEAKGGKTSLILKKTVLLQE